MRRAASTEPAVNNIRDEVRRGREKAIESFSRSIASRPGPSTEVELGEDLHLLAERLEGMDEDHRRVIELRALDNLRFKEVAERMGRSEDAVRMLFRRALVSLGGLLA